MGNSLLVGRVNTHPRLPLSPVSVLSQSCSSFVVVLRPRPFFGVSAKLPSACFLHSSFFHPANRLDPQPRTKDDDED